MALSVNTSGSQTATVTTEHTLATVTDANVFVLTVDVSAMTNGAPADRVTIREYGKARSSDTERLLKSYFIMGAQAETLFQTVPRVSPHHVRYTLTQDTGTSRAFPWAIYQSQ